MFHFDGGVVHRVQDRDEIRALLSGAVTPGRINACEASGAGVVGWGRCQKGVPRRANIGAVTPGRINACEASGAGVVTHSSGLILLFEEPRLVTGVRVVTKMAPPAVAQGRRGRPSSYKPEYAKMAFHLCKLGATDADLADAFEVSVVTIDNWKIRYPEFLGSLKGKEQADERVEQSLYKLAIGWNGQPPNVTACIFWLKNRRPDRWRDVQNTDAAIGHYILSDRPLTEDEWIEQRTKLVTPALPQANGSVGTASDDNDLEDGNS